jgi:hypothetical protein
MNPRDTFTFLFAVFLQVSLCLSSIATCNAQVVNKGLFDDLIAEAHIAKSNAQSITNPQSNGGQQITPHVTKNGVAGSSSKAGTNTLATVICPIALVIIIALWVFGEVAGGEVARLILGTILRVIVGGVLAIGVLLLLCWFLWWIFHDMTRWQFLWCIAVPVAVAFAAAFFERQRSHINYLNELHRKIDQLAEDNENLQRQIDEL